MHWLCNGRKLDLKTPKIMGIVNVTPDSFSDGGKYFSIDAAVRHGMELAAQGADILDIGGESTRPGSLAVSAGDEIARVVPVVRALKGCGALISVDTKKAEVMSAAIAAGADIINDVSALEAPGALKALAQSAAGVCLMHMRGTPESMQKDTAYSDITEEVLAYLMARARVCEEAGIARDRICIDYGFGFGKSVEGNFTLLRDTERFVKTGYPVLVGFSRKSSLGAVTGRDTAHREAATVAAHLMAVERGARIVRVHNVAGARDSIKVWEAVNGYTFG